MVEYEVTLEMVAPYGLFPTKFREVTAFDLGVGFPGLAVVTGEPVVTQDLAWDLRFLRKEVVRQGFRFFASVPLKREERVVGVLCIASRQKQPWNEQVAGFLQTMGGLLGRRTMALLLDEMRQLRSSAVDLIKGFIIRVMIIKHTCTPARRGHS